MTKRRKNNLPPADRKIGRLVRLSRERQRDDCKHAKARGLTYAYDIGTRVVEFFERLPHTKAEWAGEPFILAPWQEYDIIRPLFGWLRADGTRRFRTAYIEVARKNGKSTLAAGIGLYLLLHDNEPGAEIYTAATKRDQARIVHHEATNMIRKMGAKSGRFKQHVKIVRDNISVQSTGSKYEPLGADTDGMDGLNVSGVIIDELHAHKSSKCHDVLATATGSRRQPLMVEITTAGFDRETVCWRQREYSTKVLEGTIEDDAHFAYIATYDDTDQWDNSKFFIKANPNLGVSVKKDDLQRKLKRAKELPSEQNAFKRLHCNIWTEGETRWLTHELWESNRNDVDIVDLAGRDCYAGLDLASVQDITALVLVYPIDGKMHVQPYFWVPEETVAERSRRDNVPYDQWVREGYIDATPGGRMDFEAVRLRINELHRVVNIREIAYDRWGATALSVALEGDGFTMVQFGQGFASMSAPAKELERLLLGREIVHNGNPVLAWMAANAVVRCDPAGNIKPDKAKSSEKIDGIVALVMGLDRATKQDGPVQSPYTAVRGIITL